MSDSLIFDIAKILLPTVFVAGLLAWQQLRRRLRKSVVVDGSNVMHWNGGTPKLETLQEIVRHMVKRGYHVTVIFDANAGYKIASRYMRADEFARRLGLPKDSVRVMDRGQPADPFLFETAKRQRSRILSNDRFRDWLEQHPDLAQDGKVIRGGYDNGKLWMQA